MSDVCMSYSFNGKKSEVYKGDNNAFKVNFYSDGRLSHVTNAFSLGEAQRLAENYVGVDTFSSNPDVTVTLLNG